MDLLDLRGGYTAMRGNQFLIGGAEVSDENGPDGFAPSDRTSVCQFRQRLAHGGTMNAVPAVVNRHSASSLAKSPAKRYKLRAKPAGFGMAPYQPSESW